MPTPLHVRYAVGLLLVGWVTVLTGCSALSLRPSAPVSSEAAQVEAQLAYLEGRWFEQRYDFPRAEAAFRRALTYDPESLTLWRELVLVLTKNGEVQKAVQDFQRALAKQPTDPAWVFLMGEVYEAAGNTAEAEAAYRQAVTLVPPHAGALTALGALLMERAQEDEGVPFLEKALAADPNSREARQILLQWYQDHDDLERVKRLLKQALELDPDNLGWWIYQGKVALLERRLPEARKAFERVLDEDPDQEEARRALAEMLLEKHEWNAAVEHLEFLLQRQPDNAVVKRHLSAVYFELNRWEDARPLLIELSEKRQGDPLTHFMLGSIYRRKHLWHLAAQELVEARRSPGLKVDASLELAMAYAELNETEKAWNVLESIQAQLGNQAQRWLHVGLIALRLGNPTRALEALQRAGKLAPHEAEISFQLGRAYMALEKYPLALAAWERVIARDPKSAEAYNHLAYTCAEQKIRLGEAETWARRAVALEPENGNFQDSLGWVLFQRGKYPQALRALQQAVVCFQKAQVAMDPVVYDHLGETLMRLRRRDEALAAWKQALQLAPNDAVLQEKVKRFSK